MPSLRFTQAFFDQKSGKWYSCAYLNKAEFLQLVKTQVQTGINKLELASKTQEKSSSFSQFIFTFLCLKRRQEFTAKDKAVDGA